MKSEIKNRILSILKNELVNAQDNLFRANHAFAGCSEIQMNEQYGGSERTRQQIVDGYRQWADETKEAIAEVEKL